MLSRILLFNRHLSRARMSTVVGTIHNDNNACCTIPPVESNYEPKGTYKPYGDFQKVYVTGDESSDTAIVTVFDIFGFYPQTLQGADLIASSLKAKVYMPDFFEPKEAFPNEKYPPVTREDKAELQAFFGTTAKPDVTSAKLTKFGRLLRDGKAKKVGAYGLCWGAKVTICTGGENTPFDAVAMLHPAMLSVEDAAQLTIPLAIYASKDEPVDKYNGIVDAVSKKPFASKNDSKNYTNMFHGWAGARGDLENEENKKEFKDVYERLANFFANALT